MEYRPLGFALVALAIVLIIFDLFFRYRYVVAGNDVWRIDRVTEQACLVRMGDAACAVGRYGAPRTVRTNATHNPYLSPPTPEPNPR